MEQFDLDLTAWAPRIFRIKGATGRAYRVEEFLPNRLMLDFSRELGEMGSITRDEIIENPQRLKDTVTRVQQIVLVILNYTDPAITAEDVEADFPREAGMHFLSFLFRAWSSAQQNSPPTPALAAAAAPARAETPSSRPSSARGRKPVSLAQSTGSKSSSTSRNAPKG
ncbi:MAG: hypothetical protein ACREJ3_14320 [Polyangiaceae bacterium]